MSAGLYFFRNNVQLLGCGIQCCFQSAKRGWTFGSVETGPSKLCNIYIYILRNVQVSDGSRVWSTFIGIFMFQCWHYTLPMQFSTHFPFCIQYVTCAVYYTLPMLFTIVCCLLYVTHYVYNMLPVLFTIRYPPLCLQYVICAVYFTLPTMFIIRCLCYLLYVTHVVYFTHYVYNTLPVLFTIRYTCSLLYVTRAESTLWSGIFTVATRADK